MRIVPVIIPASPPVMKSFGLTAGALLDDFRRAIGHAGQRKHRAPRDRTDGVVGQHSRQGRCAVSAALAISLVLFMSASRIMWMPGTINPPR